MRILNFGSLNIDFTYRVPHFVRSGETLSPHSVTRNAGGKGFNQSVAFAKAGSDVYHAGHIGPDGSFLLDLCREFNVCTDYVTVIDVPTGNAVIQVDDDGSNCILLYGGANQCMDVDFIKEVLSHFETGDLLVLQNEINGINEIISLAHKAGLRIAVNPAPMNDQISSEALSFADYIILNETEAMELTGTDVPEEQLQELKKRFPESAFLLTLGTHGSIYQDHTGIFRMGACRVDAVDTTAAGDTFAGFFLASLMSGKSPEASLLTATRASALAVMKQGAATSIPCLEEVETCALQPEPF